MPIKTIKTLASIFVSLLVLVLVLWWHPWSTPGKVRHDLQLSGISHEATSKVAWKHADAAMDLAKENGVWRVNGYDTDDAHVKSFFDAVAKLEVLSLASRNAAAAADFEVSDEKGRAITFTQGGVVQEFIFGKQGNSFDAFYIKQKGSTSVYLAKGSLKSLTEQALLWWRDTTMTKLDSASIAAIEITQNNVVATLSKTKEGTWELTRGGKKTPLEASKSQAALSTLASLQASDFANSQEETVFKNAKQRASIVVRDDKNTTLAQLTLVQSKDTWIVKTQGKTALFKVPKETVEKIIKL